MALLQVHKAMLMALALGAAAALSACTHQDALAPEAESRQPEAVRIQRGRHLAEINCSSCHAIGRAGESRHPMAPPFRHLSQNYRVNQLEEAFAEGVLVGHPAMPEFQFEPQDVDALLSYIQSVQERRAT